MGFEDFMATSAAFRLWDNACSFQLVEKRVICPYHLCILATFHGFNKDDIAVNFDHHHDVFVALLQACRELDFWLENMVLHTFYVSVYTSHTFLPWSLEVLHVLNGTDRYLVERTFF